MAHRVSRKVKAELDDIWTYVATASGSLEIADSVIETITDAFVLLAKHPHIGRQRDDLRPGLRSVLAGSYVVVYRVEGKHVRVLHVAHGRRDIKAAIRH
jgi:toxin ParE1/3/4